MTGSLTGGGFRLGTPTMFVDTQVKWIQVLKEEHGLNAVVMSIKYSM